VTNIDGAEAGLTPGVLEGSPAGVTTLEMLVTGYQTRLLKFFRRRVHSVDDAADMTQDVFVKLAGMDVGRITAPGPFLFKTAVNLLRDRGRSAAYRAAAQSSVLDEDEFVCTAPLPERVVAARQQMVILEQALTELSPKCRAVFVRYRYDGWSHQRIADELGVSISMVEKYVRKALIHCRHRLDETSGEGRR